MNTYIKYGLLGTLTGIFTLTALPTQADEVVLVGGTPLLKERVLVPRACATPKVVVLKARWQRVGYYIPRHHTYRCSDRAYLVPVSKKCYTYKYKVVKDTYKCDWRRNYNYWYYD